MPALPPSRSRLLAATAGALALVLAAGWGAMRPRDAGVVQLSFDRPQAPAAPPEKAPAAPRESAATAVPGAVEGAVTEADRAAGVRSWEVPQRGRGRVVAVAGSVPAPGAGHRYRVRVEIEQGLDVDGEAFADFVLATLNDRRSWGHGGTRTFSRTAGAADIRVVLASPRTSAALCAPLVTRGLLSCARGDAAILTMTRWVIATDDYGSDRTGYRRYLVNHEVGHVLGYGHVSCPGPGRRAPVMMQQTKGLRGCLPNSWPRP